MVNLISGIKELSDEDIRLQIALFETVTFTNAVKTTGYKTVGKIFDFANKFAAVFTEPNPNQKPENETFSVLDIVIGRVNELKNISRAELDHMFRNILIEKSNTLNENITMDSASNELLSILIIKEAAKIYSIDKYLSPTKQAERICQNYYEQFLYRLHKDLVKETPEQIKITDNNLQMHLKKSDIEDIRGLSKRITLTEFSGRGIGKVLRTEVGIQNLKIIIDYFGLESFDVIKTVISSIYDTVLGINRVSRALLAQFIWVIVKANGGTFSIKQQTLPSYISTKSGSNIELQDNEYFTILNSKKNLEENISNFTNEIENITNKIMEFQEKLLEENYEYNEAKYSLENLESKKAYYDNNEVPKEELKQYYSDVILAKRNFDSVDSRIKKRTIQISDLRMKITVLKTENEECKKELISTSEIANKLTEQKTTKLELLWNAYFNRLMFEPQVYQRVVMEFTNEEMLNIEEFLKEMDDSTDIEAFSSKKIQLELQDTMVCCAICFVSDKKYADIVYENRNIMIIKISK